MRLNLLKPFTGVAFAFAVALSVLSVRAEDEILAGHTAAGLLKIDIGFAQPFVLDASIYPGISGYATGDVGFHSTILDEPANDFYQLSIAADFRFILLAKDAGIEVWNDHGSGYMTNNESFYVGPPPFDTHPIWNITTGTPGHVYAVTLKLRDLNGIYPDSTPFTLSFTPVQVLYSIRIAALDAQHAKLSWPTNAVGLELQANASLTTTNWSNVTNALAAEGTNFSVSLPTTAAQQFFRLHQP